MTTLTTTEMQTLHNIRAKVDELAHLIQEANAAGFHINFNINPMIGACDRFDVFKMQLVDLRMGAN